MKCSTANKQDMKTATLPLRQTIARVVAGGLFMVPLLASAGAWVPAEGKGYAKLGYTTYSSTEFKSDVDIGFQEFDSTSISFYGEHGLGSRWAVYGSLLSQDLEQTILETDEMTNVTTPNTTTSSGFGDLEIGLRLNWNMEPVVLATSFLIKTPALYDKDDALPRGAGQEDYEVKMHLGKGLNKFGYFGAELGYRLRSGVNSDEYRYLLEYGFSATNNLYFRTKLDGILSANNAEGEATTAEGNLTLLPEFDLGKLELTAGWNFGKGPSSSGARWGIEFTYTDEVFGDNTLQGDSIQFALTRVY